MSTKRPVTPVSIDEEGNIEKPVRKAEENTSGRPRVQSVYEGFYFRLDPDDDDGFNLLAGANCLIGTELFLEFLQGADGGPSVQIDARHEQRIATLDAKVSKRLADLRNRGWDIQVRLSVVFYEQEIKRFWGEAAAMAYDPNASCPTSGVQNFIGHIVKRIQDGDHPNVKLNQEQFEHVLDSDGAWYLTKSLPLPKIKSGQAVFKRRMQPLEHLTEAAVKGNKGCLVGSIVFWVALALALVWWFFLR